MPLIEWRQEFETGIPEVDHEHQELVASINGLHDQIVSGGTKESVSAFLGEVFAKISAHFALEETVMRKHRYDQYLAHKEEHERLLDDLREIMDNFELDQSFDCDGALSEAVRSWFVQHFKTKDARLHRLLGI